MAGENDDLDNTQLDDKTQDRTESQDVNVDNLSKELDDALNAFADETAGPSRAPAKDKDAQGREQQQDTRQQRTTQTQDDTTRTQRPPTREPTQDREVQPPARRQYGSLFQTDANGNIVDAAGRAIARTGLERKIFERTFNSFRGIETEHAANKQKLEAFENADSAAKQLGLTIEDRTAGLRLMSAWKRDPKATLNYLLNTASKDGIDVSDIRQGGAIDMSALRAQVQEVIKEAMTPFQFILDNRQQEQEQSEAREAAQQQISEFYSVNPEAQQHSPIVAAIMNKAYEAGQSMTIGEAWLTLKVHAAQNQWDLNKSLQPQAQATMNAGNNRNPTGGQGNQRPLPAMNGRGASNSTVPNNRGLAKADDSYEDIIQGAMEEVTGSRLNL